MRRRSVRGRHRHRGGRGSRVLAADPDVVAPEWLAALPLPDSGGEWVCADELLLPGSPLAQVLDEDSPFGSVDPEFVAEYGVATLRRLGAGWGS